MHARITVAMTFPAGLINQPTRGKFDLTISLRKAHELRIALLQLLGMLGADHRIFKEAAGIGQLLWIR